MRMCVYLSRCIQNLTGPYLHQNASPSKPTKVDLITRVPRYLHCAPARQRTIKCNRFVCEAPYGEKAKTHSAVAAPVTRYRGLTGHLAAYRLRGAVMEKQHSLA